MAYRDRNERAFLLDGDLDDPINTSSGIGSTAQGKDESLLGVYIRPVFMELLATFLFVFVGCGAVLSSGLMLPATPLICIAVAHGLAICVLVYASASISGGHINPVVTLAMVMCGYIDIIKGILYVIAQLCGACLGALMLKAAFPSSDQGNLGLHQLGPGVSIANGIVMEGMLTFVLVFVILRTDKDGRAVGTNAPLAIGFTVLVDHLIGVPITGASMNPARSFGPAVVTDNFHDFYVYIAGPVAGSMLAALCYIALYRNAPKDKDD